ncbi:MAG TPA: class I adenylate-forming enzyme family protein [Candidatus Wallbacteria bacterium]|nr:class I adenylate-forming enzyme family protein [Candidatus Wallbacteria bacterium]
MNISLVYRKSLETAPDRTAVAFEENKWTFRELDADVGTRVDKLEKMGVKKGDRVLIFLENRLEMVSIYMALFRIGAIAVPVVEFCKAADVAYNCNHCLASAIITSRNLKPVIEQALNEISGIEFVYVIDEKSEDASCVRFKPCGSKGCDAAGSFDMRDPAVIMYTSGSTGRPKGVTHTHYSLYNSTLIRCETLKHTSGDTYFLPVPIARGAGLTNALLPMLLAGGTSVFLRKYSDEKFLSVINEYKPTHAAAMPSQLWELLENPMTAKTDFKTIRYFFSGADFVPANLEKLFYERTGIELKVGFGMTECGGCIISPPFEKHKPGSLGKPVCGVEAKIIGEDGSELADGETGELVIKTKALMRGYWNDEQNTAAMIRNGWIYTGDLARRDDDGYFFFTGRKKFLIIRKGMNISPGEVEEVLNLHPAVRFSGVAGLPDGNYGEKVHAFIVLKEKAAPPDACELTEFASKKLAAHKVPAGYTFVESLPITEGDKVDRKKLREIAKDLLTGDKK